MADESSLSYIAFDPSWGYEEMPPVPEIPLFDLIRRSSAAYAGKTALVSLDSYWNKPEETALAFGPEGWLHTDDAGYMDGEGFIYFVERIKELIIASGYNIAPTEVEAMLMKHPAVMETAVIGVPDQYRGETVKAYIALREEYRGKVTEEEIKAFCKENISTYKSPRIVEFMDELPKSAVGKVLRRKLREMERERSAG